ncbi:MAG: hypothetical protein LBB72_04910, partial [Spirochaetaceae bacterium]|nr:hypothetical protein [Spirochaetaceae bacterium]
KDIYAGKKLSIPRPEFFVLYNGIEPYPDEELLRLSDLFERFDIPGLTEKTALELEVRVVNINEGRNEAKVHRCKELAGYSIFVAKVREYKAEHGNLETAMKRAIRYCCEQDILKEFFEQNASEVVNMLMTEWNWDDALAVRYEEGMEKGMEKGRAEEAFGIAQNMVNLGLPIETVVSATRLDPEKVKALYPR